MSKHGKPGGGNPDTNRHKDGGANEKRSITGDVHVRGEIFIEPSPKESLARESCKADEKTKERRQWWLDLATFGVLTIYASLTAIQSCQAVKSANAAQSAANTAERSARLFEAQLVPNIILQKFEPRGPLVVGKETVIDNSFANVGGTTAFDMTARSKINVLPKNQLPTFTYVDVTGSKNDAGPNTRFDEDIRIIGLTAEQAQAIASGDEVLYSSGIFVYRDFLQRWHHVYYCEMWRPTRNQFIGCSYRPDSD